MFLRQFNYKDSKSNSLNMNTCLCDGFKGVWQTVAKLCVIFRMLSHFFPLVRIIYLIKDRNACIILLNK